MFLWHPLSKRPLRDRYFLSSNEQEKTDESFISINSVPCLWMRKHVQTPDHFRINTSIQPSQPAQTSLSGRLRPDTLSIKWRERLCTDKAKPVLFSLRKTKILSPSKSTSLTVNSVSCLQILRNTHSTHWHPALQLRHKTDRSQPSLELPPRPLLF